MYNQEIKERFLSSEFGESFRGKGIVFNFEKLSREEERLSKDIAEMTIEEAREASGEFQLDELSTVYQAGSMVKRYVKWCMSERVFPDIPGGFLFFTPDWVDASVVLRELCFQSEESLLDAIRVVSGYDQGYPDTVGLALSWLGLTKREVLNLKESDVDMEERCVYLNGEKVVDGFSDRIYEVFQTYLTTDTAQRENGTTIRTVYKDKSTDGFLKKFNPHGSAKMGTGISARQFDAFLSRAGIKYTDRGNPPRLTFENVWKSGRLNALFMLEQSGVDVFAKENEDIVCKVFRNSKRYSGILWQYRAYKKAFDL